MFNFQKINIFTIKTELFSGLTSALALIPEVIAFSVVAGTSPLTAIYTSFFLCLITSLIGGRPGMISGAAGSVAIVVTALVVRYGVEYLCCSLWCRISFFSCYFNGNNTDSYWGSEIR